MLVIPATVPYSGHGPYYGPVRITAEAPSLVEVGDRPYYLAVAGYYVRPHLLRLEARPLGMAERPESLDPRPLRRARRILERRL